MRDDCWRQDLRHARQQGRHLAFIVDRDADLSPGMRLKSSMDRLDMMTLFRESGLDVVMAPFSARSLFLTAVLNGEAMVRLHRFRFVQRYNR